MPKLTLTFNLPEEREEYENAYRGGDYKAVLYEIDQFLRGKIKYAPESVTEQELTFLQELRNKLHAEAGDHGVEI